MKKIKRIEGDLRRSEMAEDMEVFYLWVRGINDKFEFGDKQGVIRVVASSVDEAIRLFKRYNVEQYVKFFDVDDVDKEGLFREHPDVEVASEEDFERYKRSGFSVAFEF